VGKTNICINAALELCQRNFRTCLLDTNCGLASMDVLLGLHPEITLDNVISGDKRLDETLLRSKLGIDVIPGGSKIEGIANLGKDRISDLILSFSQLTEYNYFLIDTPPILSREVISFCLASSETIIVITPESTSFTYACNLLKVIYANSYLGTVKILVNKCKSMPLSKRTYQRFKTAVDKHPNIRIALAGIMLDDANIARAAEQKKPLLNLFPNSIGSQCVRTMVSTLLENEIRKNSPTDLSKFWQLYFDFAHSDLSIPNKQSVPDTKRPELSTPNRQKIKVSAPIAPKTGAIKTAPAHRASQQSHISPFSHNNTIIDPLNLPSPTMLLAKSLKLQAQGRLSTDELLIFYSYDPVLMVRAMQIFCAHKNIDSNRVTKIDQIVEKLGTEVLSNLIITTSMRKAFSDPAPHDTFFVNKFWHHSCKTALLAKQIAGIINFPHPEEAFLAGLLHDIGRLSLQTGYPKAYKNCPSTFDYQDKLIASETSLFSQNHAEIGANSLAAWNLNNYIVDAARYHCESGVRIKTAFDLVKIVFLACRMTQPLQEKTAELISLGDSLLNLTSAQLVDCIEKADKKIKQISDHLNIPLRHMREENEETDTDTQFRSQAEDFSLLKSALPTTSPVKNLARVIRQIHHGIDILFGIKPVICLMVDTTQSSLQAVGYPDCFAVEILSDITMSLNSKKNLVVNAFATNKLKTSLSQETNSQLSLADEQIIRILDSDGMVCLPMTSLGITWGIIIFGIQKEDFLNIQNKFSQLEKFGTQSANNISSSAGL